MSTISHLHLNLTYCLFSYFLTLVCISDSWGGGHPTEFVIRFCLVGSTAQGAHIGTRHTHAQQNDNKHLPLDMQEKVICTVFDSVLTATHLLYRDICTHTHTFCRLIKKHQGLRGTLEMLPFLRIENVMENVAADELCLCQTQQGCGQVSGGSCSIFVWLNMQHSSCNASQKTSTVYEKWKWHI